MCTAVTLRRFRCFQVVVLSLWKLRVGAEDYYLSAVAKGIDDYYSGAGEARGRWIGSAASALNLGPAVTGDELRAVLAGLNPGTGLTPNGDQLRTWKGRVPGFDLTFSAPKSVSVMYALADPLVRAEIVEATDAAVAEAVGWLEREACFVRRGSNNRASKPAPFHEFGTRRLQGAGFVGAAFRHRTSRAGDPQLHTHVLVANTTRGSDGKWSTLDGQALYRSKVAAGAVYQTALRHELTTRLGVTWGPVHRHLADVAGVPRRVLRQFSKRRVDIEAELARTGSSGPAAAQAATLATRTAKSLIDQSTLDQRWTAEAVSVGYSPADIDHLLAAGSGDEAASPSVDVAGGRVMVRDVDRETGEVVDHVVTIEQFTQRIAHRLIEIDAAVTRHDIQNTVSDELAGGCSSATLERLTDAVLANPELVPIPAVDRSAAGWEQTWTTRTALRLEAQLVDLATPTVVHASVIDADDVDRLLDSHDAPLGVDQRDVARRLCAQGLSVEVVVGPAGTGKTHTTNAVRHIFEGNGWAMIGVATSARAARELGDGAGIDSYTIARFSGLTHTLTNRTVVVVDEAAMCNTADLVRVLAATRQAGAKTILIGDHHQLPEIGAGGGFAAATATVGDLGCMLDVNRRQRHQWEHDALSHLRNGDIRTAWNAFVANDRVVLAGTLDDVRRRAVNDWWTAHQTGSDTLLIAGTRAEATRLNELARQQLLESHQLTGPALRIESSDYQVGDHTLLLRNDPNQWDPHRQRPCRVDNGTLGTITHIDHANRTIDIELRDGRHIRLNRTYLEAGHLTHGYATTIHKAQGITVDDIFVVGAAGLYREAGYVALSRARNTARLYATTQQAAHIGEPHTTGIPLPSETADDPHADIVATLTRSRAKQFVTADHPDLAEIAGLANATTLAELRERLGHIRTIEHRVEATTTNPAVIRKQLEQAVDHRLRMHIGGRVKALDWDNVGTITHLHDNDGTADVDFTSAAGNTVTKTLPWHDLQPIDNPEPATDLTAVNNWVDKCTTRIDELDTAWADALAEHGIGPDDHRLVTAAIDHRQRQLTHRFRAYPPDWLTHFNGPRPTDPIGATVWDDELTQLVTWRDTHTIGTDTPGYGPPPTDPLLVEQWRHHLDRSLTTRNWLQHHQPQLAPQPATTLDTTTIRQRLDELDTLFETAPADQRHIIHDLTRHHDITTKLDALTHAIDHQHARRDWILEHWPHIVEHHELTTLSNQADQLAHWPTALSPTAQAAYDHLVATTTDTPEATTLHEIDAVIAQHDPATQLRRIVEQLDPLYQQRTALEQALTTPGYHPDHIQQHLDRLHQRITELQHQQRRLETEQRLWQWRPDIPAELAKTQQRRINHLTHTAITEQHAWVQHAIEAWSANPERHDPAELLNALQAVVALRERTGHEGPDPLPANPLHPAHQNELAAIKHQLQQDPIATTTPADRGL